MSELAMFATGASLVTSLFWALVFDYHVNKWETERQQMLVIISRLSRDRSVIDYSDFANSKEDNNG